MDYSHAMKASPIPAGSLVFTSTSLGRLLDCSRKHVYYDVLGKGRVQTRAFTVGSVLHACLERFLLCPEGVVPHPRALPEQPQKGRRYLEGGVLAGQKVGKPVDLFPDQWWWHTERDGSRSQINEAEQAWVRAVVEASIREKRLTHLPYGTVEKRIFLPVGVASDGTPVWYTSLIDYSSLEALVVVDHKATKDWQWCKTPEELGNNSQIVTYGIALAEAAHVLHRNDLRIDLRHHVYRKTVVGWDPYDDEPEPRNYFREVRAVDPLDQQEGVRISTLKGLWKQYRTAMLGQANQLAALGKGGIRHDDPLFFQIPGPAADSDACTKYGGCASFSQCSLRDTNVRIDLSKYF